MDASRIDALLDRAVGEQVVPGAVAVVGDREGVLYEGAFGRLSVDGDVPVQLDTMMWIASLTKAFVSVAALRLIEQGDLELEQPVADILPAFGDCRCSKASTATRRDCERRRGRRRFAIC